MLEKKIERKVVQWCVRNGLVIYKFVSPNNRGVPDRIVLGRGRVVFIEFKALGKTPTALQEREHERIRKSGNILFVCDDADHAIHCLAMIFCP